MGPQSQHWQARSPQLWNVSVSSSPFDCFRGTFARRVLLRYDITTTDLWRRRQTGIQCDKNFGASLGRFVVVIYWLALETTTTTYAPRHLIGTVVSSDRFFAVVQKKKLNRFSSGNFHWCVTRTYTDREENLVFIYTQLIHCKLQRHLKWGQRGRKMKQLVPSWRRAASLLSRVDWAW